VAEPPRPSERARMSSHKHCCLNRCSSCVVCADRPPEAAVPVSAELPRGAGRRRAVGRPRVPQHQRVAGWRQWRRLRGGLSAGQQLRGRRRGRRQRHVRRHPRRGLGACHAATDAAAGAAAAGAAVADTPRHGRQQRWLGQRELGPHPRRWRCPRQYGRRQARTLLFS